MSCLLVRGCLEGGRKKVNDFCFSTVLGQCKGAKTLLCSMLLCPVLLLDNKILISKSPTKYTLLITK